MAARKKGAAGPPEAVSPPVPSEGAKADLPAPLIAGIPPKGYAQFIDPSHILACRIPEDLVADLGMDAIRELVGDDRSFRWPSYEMRNATRRSASFNADEFTRVLRFLVRVRANEIEFSVGNDEPLRIIGHLGEDRTATFILAPRVDED